MSSSAAFVLSASPDGTTLRLKGLEASGPFPIQCRILAQHPAAEVVRQSGPSADRILGTPLRCSTTAYGKFIRTW